MTKIICNLPCLFNKIILKEKYKYLRKIHIRSYYNVLFFGSDAIALNCLQKINKIRRNENLIKRLDLVTANNSRNKTIIEKYAETENIQKLHWPHLNIAAGEYDIGLIVSFGHLIKENILNKIPLGMVNVHPSLLPRWRGAAPIIHTLLHGDEVGGVSLMKIKPNIFDQLCSRVDEMCLSVTSLPVNAIAAKHLKHQVKIMKIKPNIFDVGEIINQQRVVISKDITLPELTKQLSDIGSEMLVKCLYNLPASLENAQPQSNIGVTYAKKINKSISEVKWSDMSAREVYNLYRAIYGLYPLTTKFKEKDLKLFYAFLVDDNVCLEKPVGTLEYCEVNKSIRILCKDKKYIHFKSLRIVGRKEISALDFYNGYIKDMSMNIRL